jgi:hypothetical protein
VQIRTLPPVDRVNSGAEIWAWVRSRSRRWARRERAARRPRAGDGDAAAQQRHAVERFGFPLYTDTFIVSKVEADTRRRHLAAAHAVREQRTRKDLPNLRAVLPIANDTNAIDYLYFDDAANSTSVRTPRIATRASPWAAGG